MQISYSIVFIHNRTKETSGMFKVVPYFRGRTELLKLTAEPVACCGHPKTALQLKAEPPAQLQLFFYLHQHATFTSEEHQRMMSAEQASGESVRAHSVRRGYCTVCRWSDVVDYGTFIVCSSRKTPSLVITGTPVNDSHVWLNQLPLHPQ